MTALDSSVLVAAFASWHERHEAALVVVPGGRIVGHALLEAYSVLTRLPPPHRAPSGVAAAFLERVATSPPLTLSPTATRRLPVVLAARNISGGASYDALIAATAAEADEELLSLDRRAAVTYRLMGARHRLLA